MAALCAFLDAGADDYDDDAASGHDHDDASAGHDDASAGHDHDDANADHDHDASGHDDDARGHDDEHRGRCVDHEHRRGIEYDRVRTDGRGHDDSPVHHRCRGHGHGIEWLAPYGRKRVPADRRGLHAPGCG
jgi:hypothetical protein